MTEPFSRQLPFGQWRAAGLGGFGSLFLCVFMTGTSTTASAQDVDCWLPARANDVRCVVGSTRPRPIVRRTLAFYHEAQAAADPAESERLFLAAARGFLEAADEIPEHPELPLYLEYAAQSLRQAHRPAAAARISEREIQFLRQRPGLRDQDQEHYDRLLGSAMFVLGFNRYSAFDTEGALAAYHALLDEPVLSGANDERVTMFMDNARFNLAMILSRLQRYREAELAYRQVASASTDEAVRITAEYRAELMASRQRPARVGARMLIRFARQHASDSAYAGLTAAALIAAADTFREAGLHEEEERALRSLADRSPSDADRDRVARVVDRLRGHPRVSSVSVQGVEFPPSLVH